MRLAQPQTLATLSQAGVPSESSDQKHLIPFTDYTLLWVFAAAMNNEQFRKLLAANAKKNSDSQNGAPTGTGNALGSRQRSSIPMTP